MVVYVKKIPHIVNNINKHKDNKENGYFLILST